MMADDDINQVVPTTDSARRVVELVKKYGKNYVAGELSLERGAALTGSEIPTICGENRFEDAKSCFFTKVYITCLCFFCFLKSTGLYSFCLRFLFIQSIG